MIFVRNRPLCTELPEARLERSDKNRSQMKAWLPAPLGTLYCDAVSSMLLQLRKISKMAKAKKYDYRVVQDDTGWRAEIIRRVTSKKVMVSKRQDGFASESEAKTWGEKTLKSFLDKLKERNKRQAFRRDKGQQA